MNKSNQLAKEYAEEQNSSYTNDYYGYLNGFMRGEKETVEEIKKKIQFYRNSKVLQCDEFTLDIVEKFLDGKI